MFRRALNVLAAAGLIGTIAGAPPVWAQGFSGGLSGMSGMSVQGSGVSVTPNIYTPSYYQPPQRFRDLTVTGRVGTDNSTSPLRTPVTTMGVTQLLKADSPNSCLSRVLTRSHSACSPAAPSPRVTQIPSDSLSINAAQK